MVTEDGAERAVDTIILATGFHVTDSPMAGRVRGRGGRILADAWSAGPQAYLGTTVAGFPNLFLLIGPNTGLGHTSMVYMIESQLAYILDCLRVMERRRLRSVEVRPVRQDAFNDAVQRRMRGTVWTSGCASWYLDASGPQHHAVAGLHLGVPAAHAPLRPRALRSDPAPGLRHEASRAYTCAAENGRL